jgi:surface antigen
MFRPVFIALPLILAPLAASAPAPAATAGAAAAVQSRTGEDCSQQRQTRRSRGRAIGGVLGGMAGMFGGPAGGVAGTVAGVLPVGELLGEAIASMLDCDEQQKAAAATEEAVRGGDVGTTSTWESTTRQGVTGSSTVTAVNTSTPQGECMTVTDVVIVDGEETRADKQMCRRPPSNRYVRV